MNKLFLSIFSILSLASVSYGQISTVEKPKDEVSAKSLQWKWSTTGIDVSYLTDGVNDNRAAFKIGEGISVAKLIPGISSNFLTNSRFVSLVTVNASESGLSPRTSPALLLPEFSLTNAASLQVGVAWKGFDLNNKFRSNEGAQLYMRMKLFFPDLVKVLGLSRGFGL